MGADIERHGTVCGSDGFVPSYLRDFNLAAFWAGITGFVCRLRNSLVR